MASDATEKQESFRLVKQDLAVANEEDSRDVWSRFRGQVISITFNHFCGDGDHYYAMID